MADNIGGDVERLVLGGVLTLRTADESAAKIQAMTARQVGIEIDCEGADEVDLSFIQLLLAARLTAARADRPMRLAHPASGVLLDVLRRGGFLSSATPAADQAFWLQPETV